MSEQTLALEKWLQSPANRPGDLGQESRQDGPGLALVQRLLARRAGGY